MKTGKWFVVVVVLVSILCGGMSVQAQTTRTPQVYDIHDSLGQARFEITPTSYIYTRGGIQIVLEDKDGRWIFWMRDLVRRGIQKNYPEGWLSGEFARVIDSHQTAHIEFFLLSVPPERAIQNFLKVYAGNYTGMVMSRSESNFSIPAQTPVEVRKVAMTLIIVGQSRDIKKNIAFASLRLNERETILLAISDSSLSYTTDPTVVMNALVTSARYVVTK